MPRWHGGNLTDDSLAAGGMGVGGDGGAQPYRLPEWILWLVLCTMPTVALLGLLGNATALLLLYTRRPLARLASTAYLKALTISSSIVLLTLLVPIFEYLSRVPLYAQWDVGCKLITFVSHSFDWLCNWCIALIAIERAAVLRRWRDKYGGVFGRLCSVGGAKAACVALGAAAAVSNGWTLFVAEASERDYACVVEPGHRSLFTYLVMLETGTSIVLPLGLIVACNCVTAAEYHRFKRTTKRVRLSTANGECGDRTTAGGGGGGALATFGSKAKSRLARFMSAVSQATGVTVVGRSRTPRAVYTVQVDGAATDRSEGERAASIALHFGAGGGVDDEHGQGEGDKPLAGLLTTAASSSRMASTVAGGRSSGRRPSARCDLQLTRKLLVVTWLFIVCNLPFYAMRFYSTFINADGPHPSNESLLSYFVYFFLPYFLYYVHFAAVSMCYTMYGGPSMRHVLQSLCCELIECDCLKTAGARMADLEMLNEARMQRRSHSHSK